MKLPLHPMVVDKTTGLCRPATQSDVHRMEAICNAYDRLVATLEREITGSIGLKARIAETYPE